MGHSGSDGESSSETIPISGSNDSNPYRHPKRKVPSLWFIAVAFLSVSIVAIIVLALSIPPSVIITGYTAELKADGNVVFDVHLKNPGNTPRSVTVYCTFTVGNKSFEGTMVDQKGIVEIGAGQTLESNIPFQFGPWGYVDPSDPPKVTYSECSLVKGLRTPYSSSDICSVG
jgi:hypothetical protein